jgi:predicted dehydrogenase
VSVPAPVRLGVLGCADVAVRRVLPAVAATPGVRLVAVASRRRERAEHLAGAFGADAVTGYGALLARSDVDAVYLPLPSGLHAEWIGRALAAGKHVLAEKPLTTSAAETGRALADAAARGLVLRENVMFCHHPLHAAVRTLVERGAVGELRSFAAAFTIPPRPPGDVRLSHPLGGGALLDAAAYPLRAALVHLGRDLAVRGAVLRRGAGDAGADPGVDLGGAALLGRPDGVSAALEFGIDDAYRSTYRLAGTRGRIEVDHVFTTPPDHEPVARLTTAAGTEEIALPAGDHCRGAVAAFADAVRGGGDVPGWDAATVLAQARLVDAIRSSAGSTGTPAPDGAHR